MRQSILVLISIFIALSSIQVSAAIVSTNPPMLTKLWQSEAAFKVPESVLYDAKRKVLYVSNVDGEKPWLKDGHGSIGQLSLDGKVIKAEWVKGLHGPKGMGILGDKLFVTDIDAIVTIDIPKGKVIERFPVPNAGHINDLSVAKDGTIYFTDSKLGIVYKLINGKLTQVHQNIKSLNGVLHSNGELLFVANGSLFIVPKEGAPIRTGGDMEGGVDGVERIDDNSWLVSTWAGVVYHVTRSGKVTLLLDGRDKKINAADLGYDPINKIAYFPGFWKNNVSAYKLHLK